MLLEVQRHWRQAARAWLLAPLATTRLTQLVVRWVRAVTVRMRRLQRYELPLELDAWPPGASRAL